MSAAVRPHADQIDAEAVLSDIVRLWNKGATPLVPAAMCEPYTEDALLYGGFPEHSIRHRQIEEYFRQYDGVLTDIHLVTRDMVSVRCRPTSSWRKALRISASGWWMAALLMPISGRRS